MTEKSVLNAHSLTEQEIEKIKNDVRTRVDQYTESAKALDSMAMLDFWSESSDFVDAGVRR